MVFSMLCKLPDINGRYMPETHRNSASQLNGPELIYAGAKLLWHPSIRWMILIPLCINIVLFSSITVAAGQWLSGWLESLITQVPEWLHWLVWIIWILFGALALVIYAFTFTLIANLFGSPFHGIVAERVILLERGEQASLGTTPLLTLAWNSFVRQLQLLRYFVPRTLAIALLTLVVSWIPLLNLSAPLIAGSWAAWSLCIQYLDYGADADQVLFPDLIKRAGQDKWRALGFGFAALAASSIPLLNLVALPAAVIGGTLFWCRGFEVRR
jgi:CysZ protein